MVGHDETQRRQAQQAIAMSTRLVTLGEITTSIAHVAVCSVCFREFRIVLKAMSSTTTPAPGWPAAGLRVLSSR